MATCHFRQQSSIPFILTNQRGGGRDDGQGPNILFTYFLLILFLAPHLILDFQCIWCFTVPSLSEIYGIEQFLSPPYPSLDFSRRKPQGLGEVV